MAATKLRGKRLLCLSLDTTRDPKKWRIKLCGVYEASLSTNIVKGGFAPIGGSTEFRPDALALLFQQPATSRFIINAKVFQVTLRPLVKRQVSNLP
jgi:hypothetical protein